MLINPLVYASEGLRGSLTTNVEHMRLYAVSGDRAAAVPTYHTCSSVLERELGVKPGWATREAYAQLVQTKGSPVEVVAHPAHVVTARLVAMETVRLMNTGMMNRFSAQRGVGMARMDYLDYARLGEPIADPAVADALAIRSRHDRL